MTRHRYIDEVTANLLREPWGDGTLADLDPAPDFLRRVAGRVLRASFREHFRAVEPTPRAMLAAPGTAIVPSGVRTVACSCDEIASQANTHGWTQCRPVRPGFAADIPPNESPNLSENEPPAVLAANRALRRSLAKEGLITATLRALDAARAAGADAGTALSAVLRAGVPADLLAMYRTGPATPRSAESVVRDLASMPREQPAESRAESFLRAANWAFVPTPGFLAAADDGTHRCETLRFQAARGRHWLGPDDGGNMDAFSQLLGHTSAPAVVCVQSQAWEEALAVIGGWPEEVRRRLSLARCPWPLSQWAHDNMKRGTCQKDGGELWLAPRYTTRGELGAEFIPGESLVRAACAAAGLRSLRSPLLFQGGNLLIATFREGERVLLVGEAEIERNRCLGLSREQAAEALRAEFRAERLIVLPAVSFHADFDVAVQRRGSGTHAFIADPEAGTSMAVASAYERLRDAGFLPRGEPDSHAILSLLATAASRDGRIPHALARIFSDGPSDAPETNVSGVLLACDWMTLKDAAGGLPEGLADYAESLADLEIDRKKVEVGLRAAGFEVSGVPALPEGHAGAGYLNGVMAEGVYLTGTCGGFWSRLDDTACAAFGTDVRTVRAMESLRREGGVRCMNG